MNKIHDMFFRIRFTWMKQRSDFRIRQFFAGNETWFTIQKRIVFIFWVTLTNEYAAPEIYNTLAEADAKVVSLMKLKNSTKKIIKYI